MASIVPLSLIAFVYPVFPVYFWLKLNSTHCHWQKEIQHDV